MKAGLRLFLIRASSKPSKPLNKEHPQLVLVNMYGRMNAFGLCHLLWAVINSPRRDLAVERDSLMTELMNISGT